MKKICIVTATRAEYGLLKPLIKAVKEDTQLELMLVVTGTHLIKKFGETFKEIDEDGFSDYIKLPIDLIYNDVNGVARAIGDTIAEFSILFSKNTPDMVVILGDRYEMLGVAVAATINKIPIAHIHGGESTEGAIDEAFRHAITKMSYLHFASTKQYRDRIIQLGETPDRVYNVGALGAENIGKLKLLTKIELEKNLKFTIDENTILVTYHPVTLGKKSSKEQIEELLAAISQIDKLRVIFTKANADTDGNIINNIIEKFVREDSSKYILFESLGQLRYLSTLQYVRAIVGNSSSGIVEVPFFGIPTVNIGDRQKGRLQAKSVINCKSGTQDIYIAIREALDKNFYNRIKDIENPYDFKNTTEEIIHILKEVLEDNKIDLKKKFYDLGVSNV